MGFKRQIYSSKSKHRWHISASKVRRMDVIYLKIEREKETTGAKQNEYISK